jgi:molybdate transport system substrate-binding protein
MIGLSATGATTRSLPRMRSENFANDAPWCLSRACSTRKVCGKEIDVAKLKVMCARSMTQAMKQLAGEFMRTSGHDVAIEFGTVGALQARIAKGEAADIYILGAPAIARMEKEGAVAAGSATDVASTAIGIAVREGAAGPDISTPDAFRAALANARAIAFSDAAVGGSAGVYLKDLFERMGLADAIRQKGMPQTSGGVVATRVAEGRADIGMTLMAEIAPIKGARILGPLPPPLGHDAAYRAGIATACGDREAAAAFIAALTRPETRKVWEAAGFK